MANKANAQRALFAEASPTKRFFISVLVKDLLLMDAIVELVDNVVDAARTGKSPLRKIRVEINYDKDRFEIRDNASGISIATAENYAFRFGRAIGAPKTPRSVGEFGVGMKRALFKMGRLFVVESRTVKDWFKLPVDVDVWEALPETDPNAWKFKFEFARKNPTAKIGTVITVKRLYDYTVQDFTSGNFETRLADRLKETHAESLGAGLKIVVNKTPVTAEKAALQVSKELRPIHKSMAVMIDRKKIDVDLWAGTGEPRLVDAGWYIYCNGRLIERADKSQKTGWNTELDGSRTPKPHWQFRRFRGYVFFESAHADVLPWNTTKTNLDVEAPVYRRVLNDMTTALHSVIEFLNAVDEEASAEDRPLSSILDTAKMAELADIKRNSNFTWKKRGTSSSPKFATITYKRPAELVELVRERLDVGKNSQIGERTFDYYVEAEGIDG